MSKMCLFYKRLGVLSKLCHLWVEFVLRSWLDQRVLPPEKPILKGCWMVLQKTLDLRKIYSNLMGIWLSHFFSSYRRSSHSLVSHMKLSQRLNFSQQLMGLQVLIHSSTCLIMTSFITGYWISMKQLTNFREKLILTTPKLSEFLKKLQKLPKHPFWCREITF